MAVLSVDDAKAYLRITVDTYDDEIEGIVAAAEAAIAQRVGPLEPTSVTARVSGGSGSLVLPVVPAVSLTSVTPYGGSALTVGDLRVNGGVVTYADSASSFTGSTYTVVYSAGRTTCPADLLLAVKELVRHLWGSQRGPARAGAPMSDATANTVPGAAYLLPFRVTELLAPHLSPGFA